MDTAETPAETRREMPPFMPGRLLLQESEDPRVGPGALDGIRRDLSRARSDGLSGLFSAMDTADPSVGSFTSISVACAWDLSRRVYRVPAALAEELSAGCGRLPACALAHLPVDDLYISFGDGTGALASALEEGVLAVLLEDIGGPAGRTVAPVPLRVPWDSTVEEVVEGTVRRLSALAAVPAPLAAATDLLLSRTLASLMYLSSENADMVPLEEPRTARRRSIRRRFPKRRPCELADVGYNLLSDLRRARSGQSPGEGPGRTVAPHIRRGHWHTYHHGPKGAPTDTFVRWVAPVAVNAGGGAVRTSVTDVDGT